MSYVKVTEDNFENEVLQSEQPVVIDFWATWCMPCTQFAPTFESVSEALAGKAKFVKIDVDESKKLAIKYKVLSIPTIMVVKNGEAAERHSGVMDEATFKTWVEQAL